MSSVNIKSVVDEEENTSNMVDEPNPWDLDQLLPEEQVCHLFCKVFLFH